MLTRAGPLHGARESVIGPIVAEIIRSDRGVSATHAASQWARGVFKKMHPLPAPTRRRAPPKPIGPLPPPLPLPPEPLATCWGGGEREDATDFELDIELPRQPEGAPPVKRAMTEDAGDTAPAAPLEQELAKWCERNRNCLSELAAPIAPAPVAMCGVTLMRMDWMDSMAALLATSESVENTASHADILKMTGARRRAPGAVARPLQGSSDGEEMPGSKNPHRKMPQIETTAR